MPVPACLQNKPPLAIPKVPTLRKTITTPAGNSQCRIDFVTLKIGKSTFYNQRLASYEGITRDNVDVDGMLPTSMLDRLFISHVEAYAIANPHLRKVVGGSTSR